MPTDSDRIIELNHVSISFDGAPVIEDLSLEVKQGANVLLKGPSGSGKTSLFHVMMGFLRQSGEVRMFGEELTSPTVWSIRSRTALVSQDLALGTVSVQDYVREVLHYKQNRSLPQPEQRVHTNFKHLQLSEKTWQADLGELSGGERQRVALALAEALQRELYLLDEPTASLDAELKQVVVDWFLSMDDRTIVVASHDEVWQRNALRMVDLTKR